MFFPSILGALLTVASAQVEVTLCSDSQCNEPPLSIVDLESTSGCQTSFPGFKVLSVKTNHTATSTLPKKNQAVRFYRSNDCFVTCGSNHLISQTPAEGWMFLSLNTSMSKPLLQSFELVDVNEDGTYVPHGYCGLRHGDAQYFRERAWKWQQIGRHAFREIPIEDWDDAVHVRRTAREYDRHGAVDAKGEFKWQQVKDQGWRGVRLGEWDDGTNARWTGEVLVIESSGAEEL